MYTDLVIGKKYKISLYPDKYYIIYKTNPYKDIKVKNIISIGILKSIFLNTKLNEIWGTFYSPKNNIEYNIPIYNVLNDV